MCTSGLPATVVSGGNVSCAEGSGEHHVTEEGASVLLPVLREVAKELEKYPNVELVDVTDARDHVAGGDGRREIGD